MRCTNKKTNTHADPLLQITIHIRRPNILSINANQIAPNKQTKKSAQRFHQFDKSITLSCSNCLIYGLVASFFFAVFAVFGRAFHWRCCYCWVCIFFLNHRSIIRVDLEIFSTKFWIDFVFLWRENIFQNRLAFFVEMNLNDFKFEAKAIYRPGILASCYILEIVEKNRSTSTIPLNFNWCYNFQ